MAFSLRVGWCCLVLYGFFFLSGCGNRTPYVKIKGSETVLPIALELAEVASLSPNLPKVSVTAGGSGVGIAALLENNTDIAMSSRDMKFEEKLRFQAQQTPFEELTIAYDALAIIVHPDNPIDTLTLDQLKGIYQGKYKNWIELGGRDLPIVAYNRESSSGTYEFFKKEVLNKEKFDQLETVGANGELVEKIVENARTIAYVGIAFVDPKRVKVLKIFNPTLKRSIPATIESSMDKSYALSRPLYFYYKKNAQQKVQPVIDYIRSRTGQALVRKVGYPPNPLFYQ